MSWSSYRRNAHGEGNTLITPHDIYLALGLTDELRQAAYRDLFKTDIGEHDLSEIRHAANKEWILGSEQFKRKIEQKLQRRTTPLPRGGDRRSKRYKSLNPGINRH